MMGDAMTLRRGKPEDRSNFDRAKHDFETAKGDIRSHERIDNDTANGGCPICHAPMTLRNEYRGEQSYHFVGICSADPTHDIERFGYYSTEGT
jgi:hypothetical protein